MIEPFSLPEAIPILRENIGGPVSGPAFEVLQRLLQSQGADLAEQVQVRRHDHIFEHMPVGALATVLNGLDYQPSPNSLPQNRLSCSEIATPRILANTSAETLINSAGSILCNPPPYTRPSLKKSSG